MAAPVSLPEAKKHLKVTSSAEDDVIQGALDAAHQHVEDVTGLVLEPRVVIEDFAGWSHMRIRSWPVQQITEIAYVDRDGTAQILAPNVYASALRGRPVRIGLIGTGFWPSCATRADAVSVKLAAGYATASAVPASVKRAILLLTGHFYASREAVAAGSNIVELPLGVAALLRRYRFRTL